MGDALHEPLPLRPGRYRQGPYEFELRRWRGARGRQFRHDPAGSFVAITLESRSSGS